jgi:hypothetical protein
VICGSAVWNVEECRGRTTLPADMMLSLVSAMRGLARRVVDRPHRALAAERVPRRPVAAHALPEGPRPLGVEPRAEAVAAVLQVAPQGVDEGDRLLRAVAEVGRRRRIIRRSTARSCSSPSPSEILEPPGERAERARGDGLQEPGVVSAVLGALAPLVEGLAARIGERGAVARRPRS